jgi:hypothetical protein
VALAVLQGLSRNTEKPRERGYDETGRLFPSSTTGLHRFAESLVNEAKRQAV